ncbi:MAG: hypothetical protein Q4C03_01830, partial [bacterium]|nr:hypothetical protein [bacterium]
PQTQLYHISKPLKQTKNLMNYDDKDFDETGSRKDCGSFECAIITFGSVCALAGAIAGLILGRGM